MLLPRTFQYKPRVVSRRRCRRTPKVLNPICLLSFGRPLLLVSALPGCCGVAFDLSEGDFQSTRCGCSADCTRMNGISTGDKLG
uniref:AT31442p n=1 Tax=Drosophila melanogaster TaxID=7227 RepID=Q8IH83_DROME|nr:AT31442p [Drosophila melanogaster]